MASLNLSSVRKYKSFLIWLTETKKEYKILREMPLYYLDEEEFKFVVKTLLDAKPEEG